MWLQPRLVEAEAAPCWTTSPRRPTPPNGCDGSTRRHLNLGCELTVFAVGIIPGDTNADRAANSPRREVVAPLP